MSSGSLSLSLSPEFTAYATRTVNVLVLNSAHSVLSTCRKWRTAYGILLLGSPSLHYCRHDDIGSSRNRLSGRHLAVPDCCREARAELQALIQKAACDRPPWNQGQPFRQFQPMQSERHNTLTKRHHSQKVRARDVQAADQPPTGPTGKEENTNKTNHES
ncbi:LOW QUALITY PROTEIN: hypothetical protein N5P37_005136 [Trichoderma harzianum]|nr:LOW QUALITY PROTEIN: hypothetical protein N5P37_005136 [Trichoderma harzianum]